VQTRHNQLPEHAAPDEQLVTGPEATTSPSSLLRLGSGLGLVISRLTADKPAGSRFFVQCTQD